jgi:hypothetical protein
MEEGVPDVLRLLRRVYVLSLGAAGRDIEVEVRTVELVDELDAVMAERGAAVFELLCDALDVYGVFAVEKGVAGLVARVPVIEAVGALDLLTDSDYFFTVEWLRDDNDPSATFRGRDVAGAARRTSCRLLV